MADTLTSSDFVPQTVTPPEKPLPLVRGLMQMIANPLYVWPQAMYENPYHGVKWIGRTFHYIRKPEHMKAVFLDHADIFKKSQFQKKLVGPALGDGLLTAEGDRPTQHVHPQVDVRAAGDLLSRAGFAMPVADSDTLSIRYGDIVRLMHDLRGMGGGQPGCRINVGGWGNALVAGRGGGRSERPECPG